ncbi:MAG: hypothetical protein AAF264_12555 [Pseudomonadota bacterium]
MSHAIDNGAGGGIRGVGAARIHGVSPPWRRAGGADRPVAVLGLDDPGRSEPRSDLCADRKPARRALAGIRKIMTEAEVFAMFAPEGETK